MADLFIEFHPILMDGDYVNLCPKHSKLGWFQYLEGDGFDYDTFEPIGPRWLRWLFKENKDHFAIDVITCIHCPNMDKIPRHSPGWVPRTN